jgi:hypothetical protein
MGLRGHKTEAAVGGQSVRLLVALVGPSHIAFPAHWVRGIITVAEAGSHNQVTWVETSYERTDLAGRLALGQQAPTAESRIILYGNGQQSRAFMVDGVVGLVDASRSQVQSLPPQFRGGERDRLLGIFTSATYVALMVNPFWVLELPSRSNAPEGLALPHSERNMAELESKPRLPRTILQDPAPATAVQ